jgi:DtxR family Mn-dependent transcriptional regulator
MASQVVEDYLKTIYKLQRKNERVTTSELAKALGVSPASVTNMVKKLSKMHLIRHRSYQGVELLKAGKKIALEIIRHHRLLELYLKEALGYSWDCVHDEAEKLEHHISEDFEQKIFEVLGNPEFDPHGDPIPSKDGQIKELACDPLSIAEPGDKLVIRRVDDDDPKLLLYLEEVGLMPNVKIELLEKAPFQGPFTVKIGDQVQVIGHQVVENVYVSLEEVA